MSLQEISSPPNSWAVRSIRGKCKIVKTMHRALIPDELVAHLCLLPNETTQILRQRLVFVGSDQRLRGIFSHGPEKRSVQLAPSTTTSNSTEERGNRTRRLSCVGESQLSGARRRDIQQASRYPCSMDHSSRCLIARPTIWHTLKSDSSLMRNSKSAQVSLPGRTSFSEAVSIETFNRDGSAPSSQNLWAIGRAQDQLGEVSTICSRLVQVCRCSEDLFMALILETSRTSILTTLDIIRVGDHLKIRLQPGGLSFARLGLRHQVWEGGQASALPKIITSPHPNIVRDHTFGYGRRRRYHWHRLGCNHKPPPALKRSNIVPSGNINLSTADDGGVEVLRAPHLSRRAWGICN